MLITTASEFINAIMQEECGEPQPEATSNHVLWRTIAHAMPEKQFKMFVFQEMPFQSQHVPYTLGFI